MQDQHRLNQETAERHGWTVVHEYTDNDKSAAKADVVRDDFEAMLRALRAGELPDGTAVQGVVIVAEDRLARRPGDYERFVEAITYQDGRVFADARGTKDLYSEDTESMGLFGAVISKMEVRKMQRRMRRSHRTRAEQGLPVGGTRPFGWKPDRLTLDPEEASVLAAGDTQRGITEGTVRLGATAAEEAGIRHAWEVAGLRVTEHARRMIYTCFSLADLPPYRHLPLRQWAYMLGHGGHFSTKSCHYSIRLGDLRQARADYRAEQARLMANAPVFDAADTLTVAEWRYAGSGHRHGEAFWAEAARQRIDTARGIRRDREGDTG